MEDSISLVSSESITNSDEYVFVNKASGVSTASTDNVKTGDPLLGIANNGDINDLCNELKEVLNDVDNQVNDSIVKMPSVVTVGNSKFYNDETSPMSEKKDVNKSDVEEDIEVFEDVQQECTIFSGVCYLGSATISAPKSENEIQRNVEVLNEESLDHAIRVSVSVPSSSEGFVVLYDAGTQQVMARYEIHRILFFARGKANSGQLSCFAFTWSHGETRDNGIFQCHVFRCDIPEAVGQVSQCFARAFQQQPSNLSVSEISTVEEFVFEVTMEVKEEDGRGGYTVVPRDRNGFKIRVDQEKELALSVRQVSGNQRQLEVERCFGVLVAPGRGVRHSDMHLLEMVSMGSGNGEKQTCLISGRWDPQEPAFMTLNQPTVRDTKTYVTVAVDLVVRGIREPVRFLIETPVKILPSSTRFWYIGSRKLVQQFFLHLRETGGDTFEVLNIETSGELDRSSRLNLPLNLAYFTRSPSLSSLDTLTPKDPDQDSDNDEPLLSGTGEVSKECSATELEVWADALTKWGKGEVRPKHLGSLVRDGIPEALRGELWQRLSGCEDDKNMMDNFRILITKECACESVIQRDINRTFPAHDFFKEAGGLGQDSLYRLTKAYAVHDKEVGYCQGLSFVAATLLLHMPEEQAFCVLVRMMYQYGLRELYKDGFENLYLRLYQLNRLMEEQLPALWQHLTENSVESHMFASQWFLTVFTARFPLFFVFHILDVFLLQGVDTLFQVALSLLMMCKKDLMQLDFESILKYFRVTLPKKCRSEEVARGIMKHACSQRVKKLKKYEHEFIAMKEAQDNADSFSNELECMKAALERSEEEKKRLEVEVTQVKAMLKREVDRAESDASRSNTIIAEYKKINARLDDELAAAKNRLLDLRNEVSQCENCRKRLKSMEIVGEKTYPEPRIRDDDPQLPRAMERIRELELELAQTKLERVEAECWKQELTHQLHATLAELQTAKTSWIHKTLSTLKDATVNKREGDVSNGPESSESGDLIKKVFAARRASKDKEHAGHESPRRSQTMETMNTKTFD